MELVGAPAFMRGERARISYIAALSEATYAAFLNESRIRGRVQCSVQENPDLALAMGQPWVSAAFRALLTNCSFRRTASTAMSRSTAACAFIT
jgi:hypothetical protein